MKRIELSRMDESDSWERFPFFLLASGVSRFVFLLGCLIPTALCADGVQSGSITSVTVYPGFANVERTVALPAGESGNRILQLGPIPASLRDRSVRVSTEDGIQVLSVKVRRNSGDPVEPSKLRELRKNVEVAQQSVQTLQRKEETLAAMQVRYEGLIPEKPGKETSGPLSLQAWQGLTDLILRGIDTTSIQRQQLVPQLREARQLLEQLNSELQQLNSKGQRSQATLEVEVLDGQGAGGVFRVQYQLPGATWKPAYDVSVNSQTKQLFLRSYAEVRQWTGEDWPAVPMFFSTSLPESGAEPGDLAALIIERPRFLPPAPVMSPRVEPMTKKGEDFDRGLSINGNRLQQPPKRSESERYSGRLVDTAGVDVFGYRGGANFLLDDRGFLSIFESIYADEIPANGAIQRRLYSISTFPYLGDHRCIPELEEAIFRRLKLTVTGQDPLLAGPVSVFVDEDYLGVTSIAKTVAPGEELHLDLGVLDHIKVTRTTEESEETRGLLSRVIEYRTETRLRFENYGNSAETFEVLEHIPVTDDELISIKIDRGLSQPGPEEANSAAGLLRWPVTVEAGKSLEILLVWTMQIPKDKILRLRPAPERLGDQ